MSEPARRPGRRLSIAFWAVAAVCMLAAVVYQRRTGPTRPLRTAFEVAGETLRAKLIRTHVTTADAPVVLPAPEAAVSATLYWRRFGTGDEFAPLPMVREGDDLVARLPAQPPAGKLDYHVVIAGPDGDVRLPPDPGEHVTIRFKGEVPPLVLAPHIALMFLAILLGLRTGLAALFAPAPMRRLTVLTLAGLTLGGMILGPCVQEYAFGEFWTGWPNGKDLTDNKTLLMWGAWVVAAGFLLLRGTRWPRASRIVVVAATVVMLFVYLIPHSLRGSSLDYSKLDGGVPAEEAIETGR